MENNKIRQRLNELISSAAYKEDFNKLIHQILLNRKRKYLRFVSTLLPKDWDGDLKKMTQDISFAQFERILRSETINNFWILIPSLHLNFIDKWDIQYFFNPTENIPFNFNPFIQRFPVLPCFPSTSGRIYDRIGAHEMAMANPRTAPSDPYKLYVGIDVRFPLKIIFREVKKQIKEWRDEVVPSMPTLKGRPKSKANTLEMIRGIWEKQCRGKRLTGYQKSKIISEGLGHDRDPITIYRHYLPMIEKEKKSR